MSEDTRMRRRTFQYLFETSLNTILRRRAKIAEIEILKSSISVKLQVISIIYGLIWI